jgi:hypothetical protein
VSYFFFSTGWTHRANPLGKPVATVFHVVHTPYDCYEEKIKENDE